MKNLVGTIYDSLVDFSEFSYSNYLETYEENSMDYDKVARFEARIYALFWTNHILYGKTEDKMRFALADLVIRNIQKDFKGELRTEGGTDLGEVAKFRLNEYVDVAKNATDKTEGMENIINKYLLRIDSAQGRILKKSPPIILRDIFTEMPKKANFFKDQIEMIGKFNKLLTHSVAQWS